MAANEAPLSSLGSDAAAAAAMATGAPATNPTSRASPLEATGSASTSSIAAAAPEPPVAAAAEIIHVDEEAQATASQAGAEVDAVAVEEDASGNWTPSTITTEQLKELENDGLLPAGIWRSAENHPEPDPQNGERVMLVSHIDRGLGFPPSAFFLEVLSHYGVQPHNLTPNSILYIAAYQALFEGYLGIAPRLDFFKYCFYVRRQTVGADNHLAVCGTINFNLRRNREDWFPKVPKSDSVKGWTGTFFYCKDVPFPGESTGIPAFVNAAAAPLASWKEDAVKTLPADLQLIQRRIEKLTTSDPELNGIDTVVCWFSRRIQPLTHHPDRLICDYTGKADSLRCSNQDLSDSDLCHGINRLIAVRGQYSENFPMFTADNKPPQVITLPVSINLCRFDDLTANLRLTTLQINELSEEHLAQAGDAAAKKKRKVDEAAAVGGTAGPAKRRKKSGLPPHARVINLEGATVASSS